MPVFSGNTSTSALGTSYDIPGYIECFSLTNKSASSITVNVSILYGSTNIWITPKDVVLLPGEMLEDNKKITLLANRQIYVLASGSCDYYFSIHGI